jgi:hypothetical protein
VTPEELVVIKAGAETALDAVHRGWPWPEIDNDLVIGASLKDVPALVAEVDRLRAALETCAEITGAPIGGKVLDSADMARLREVIHRALFPATATAH